MDDYGGILVGLGQGEKRRVGHIGFGLIAINSFYSGFFSYTILSISIDERHTLTVRG